MRARTILALALLASLLAVRATSQEAPKAPRQALCRFSDGSTITVTYSLERKSYMFATDGSLVTVKGVHVPAGDYALSRTKGGDDNWILTMRKRLETPKAGEWVLPPLPMSLAAPVLPLGDFPVFFDQTGGSCTLYWRLGNSGTALSLEFTKENADQKIRRFR